MKKFLVLLGTIGLTAASSMTVIACATINLSAKSINRNLGVLEWNGRSESAIPEDKAILDAFNKVNRGKIKEKLTEHNVRISNKTRHSATITAHDEDLKGRVNVRYSLTNRGETDLSGSQTKGNVLSTLGEINHATSGDNWILAAPQDVLDGFLLTNEFLFKNGMQLGKNVEIVDITSTSATIRAIAGQDEFTGEVRVNFTTKRSEFDLKFKEYRFKQNTINEQILERIKSDNPDLKFTELDLQVSEIKNNLGTITITVKVGSTIYSPLTEPIIISFTIERFDFKAPRAFDNFKNDKFDFNATIEDVEAAFKEKYKNEKIGGEPINFDELEIKTDLATKVITITVKEGSTVYNPLDRPIEVKFTVKTVAETKLPPITLEGNGKDPIPSEKILEQINSQFKRPLEMGGDIAEIIVNDTKTAATIKLNADKYGPDSTLSVVINFADTRSKLEDVITVKNLGELEDNNLATVKAAIDAKYPGLTSEQGISVVVENNTAKVIAKDSEKYQDGTVKLTFTVKDHRSKLEDVITIKDLGELEDKNLETVKAAIDAKYPGLTSETGITIVVNANNTVTITAKNSDKYLDGSITLTFTIKDHRLKLEDVITNRNLGELDNNELATIKAAIDAKYPGLTSEVGITVVVKADNTATITAKDSTKYLDGSIDMIFTIKDHRSRLEDVIVDTNLGELEDNNLPTVKVAIDAKYPGLTSEVGITVTVNANNTATITAKDSTKYLDGSVNVTFTIKDHRLKLSDVVVDTNLGELDNNNLETIKVAIDAKYPGLTSDSGITVVVNTNNTATITAKDSTKYLDGSVNVTFTIKDHRLKLSDVVVDTNLGELEDNNLPTVKVAIDAKYPGLTSDSGITVVVNANNTATITAKDSTKYLDGSVNVTFTIKDHRLKLSDVIKNTDLGALLDLPAILNKIATDFGLINGQDGITIEVHLLQGRVTITSRNSTKYQDGTIELTFRLIRQQLGDVITNTNLGELEDNDLETVKAAIDAQHPGLTSEVGISVVVNGNTARNKR